ncbi:integrase domain-containing protein, partial [Shimia sp. R11_0]|uniref:phage integrase N-terminal domain-containing protein n=1 Tax=Shimia sp. R11_0 TaxID=2821096 RepID=UPI001ADC5163
MKTAPKINQRKTDAMDALAFDLKKMTLSDRTGSRQTQTDRARMVQAMARDLKGMGFRLPSARSLKPKHVERLVKDWKSKDLSAGVIKNRMSTLRWWAKSVNKASVVHRSNDAYGIERRSTSTENKAQRLNLDKVGQLPCKRMQLAVRMAAAFGLRVEEALKFQPRLADKGDKIALKPSWTKGGRYREIPIHTERHRALLNEVRETVGDGSLIPEDKRYIDHRKAFEYQALKAGMSNLHGLRHGYAQWRYKALTGRPCPKAGG